MKQTFLELINYIKNPVLEKDPNTDNAYRFKKLFHLLIICLLTALVITPIFGLFEEMGWVDLKDHAIEQLMEQFSFPVILFLVVVFAPLFEEAIFRAPITLFKKPKTFKIAFYVFAFIFGYVHITNFELTDNVWILSPLLVLPQIILGLYLGFIRVRFGLVWSILLHALYNLIVSVIAYYTEFA